MDSLENCHAPKNDVIVDDTIDRAEVKVVLSLLPVFCVTGTAGNALVLCVFSQRKDRLVSTIFILSLAVVDLITCCLIIPFTVYMEYTDFYVEADVVCKAYQFLITSSIPFSVMTMVAIAIDRYFSICHPWLTVITVRRARIAVAGLGLLAASFGACISCMYGINHPISLPTSAIFCNSTSSSDGRSECLPTDLHHNSTTVDWNGTCTVVIFQTGLCSQNTLILSETFQYYYQQFHTALYVACFLCIFVLYSVIYCSVSKRRRRRSQERRRRSTSATVTSAAVTYVTLTSTALIGVYQRPITPPTDQSKKAEPVMSHFYDKALVANLKTALMLFVVTIVFILTFLPAWLMVNYWIPFSRTAFYMYFANNVANPIIYSFMNQNFRDKLKKLAGKRR